MATTVSRDEVEVRLTARGRRVLLVAALLLAAAVGAVGGRAVAAPEQGPVAYETITVSSGDTLWEIATEVAAPGDDVRDVVESLVRLNELPSVDLRAGQELRVPDRGDG